jgi:hypothetical protein
MSTATATKSPRALILANRKAHGDTSRAAQSRRLGIPETSLRQYEQDDRLPPYRALRDAFFAALAMKP